MVDLEEVNNFEIIKGISIHSSLIQVSLNVGIIMLIVLSINLKQ